MYPVTTNVSQLVSIEASEERKSLYPVTSNVSVNKSN